MRVVGYIDGMNFYETSKHTRWYPAGWCNWTQTLGEYCPGSDVSIRYFTTLYAGNNPERVGRQKLHIRAMEKVAGAEIVYGSCRRRHLNCQNCGTALKCPKCGWNERIAEKMTDVNIAVRLLLDAMDDKFDRAYVVSGDVDLVPAIDAVMSRFRKVKVFVLVPPETSIAEDLAKLQQAYPGRSWARSLDVSDMRRFPDDLPRRWGMQLPEHWREGAGERPTRPGQYSSSRGPKPRY